MTAPSRKQHFEIWIVTGGRQQKRIYLTKRQAAAFARRYNEHVDSRDQCARIERAVAYYSGTLRPGTIGEALR